MPIEPLNSKEILEFLANCKPISTDGDHISDEDEEYDEDDGGEVEEEEEEEGVEEGEEKEEEEEGVMDLDSITPADLARAFNLSLLAMGLDVRAFGASAAGAAQEVVESPETEVSAGNKNTTQADGVGEAQAAKSSKRYLLRHPSLLKPTERARGVLRRE